MAEIIYVARFTEKSGFPVEKEYKTREGAVRAIKRAKEKYGSDRFFATIKVFDEDNYRLDLVFEQIGDKVIRDIK